MKFVKLLSSLTKWWRVDARIFKLEFKRIEALAMIESCKNTQGSLEISESIESFEILDQIIAKYQRRIARINKFMYGAK